MKTKTPKLFFNLSKKYLLFDKFSKNMRKKVTLLFVFMSYVANISAQESRMSEEVPRIKEVKSFITTLKSNEQSTKGANLNSQNLEKLLYKVQSSVYIQSNDVKTYGDKPTNLFVDISTMSMLEDSRILKNNIEIVTIKINNTNDLSSSINLSLFSNYKNLKYIHIVSNVSTTENFINSMLQNLNQKYTVFYSISNGDSN